MLIRLDTSQGMTLNTDHFSELLTSRESTLYNLRTAALYYFQLWFMMHLSKLKVMCTGQPFAIAELCQLSPSAVLGIITDNIYDR